MPMTCAGKVQADLNMWATNLKELLGRVGERLINAAEILMKTTPLVVVWSLDFWIPAPHLVSL